MIVKKSECIKLSLNPTEVTKEYSIYLDSTFERFTGKNLRVFVNEIRRKQDGKIISNRQLAEDLAKKLEYENFKRVSINIVCTGYWEPSEDGFSDHDTLRRYISSIDLDIIM